MFEHGIIQNQKNLNSLNSKHSIVGLVANWLNFTKEDKVAGKGRKVQGKPEYLKFFK